MAKETERLVAVADVSHCNL